MSLPNHDPNEEWYPESPLPTSIFYSSLTSNVEGESSSQSNPLPALPQTTFVPLFNGPSRTRYLAPQQPLLYYSPVPLPQSALALHGPPPLPSNLQAARTGVYTLLPPPSLPPTSLFQSPSFPLASSLQWHHQSPPLPVVQPYQPPPIFQRGFSHTPPLPHQSSSHLSSIARTHPPLGPYNGPAYHGFYNGVFGTTDPSPIFTSWRMTRERGQQRRTRGPTRLNMRGEVGRDGRGRSTVWITRRRRDSSVDSSISSRVAEVEDEGEGEELTNSPTIFTLRSRSETSSTVSESASSSTASTAASGEGEGEEGEEILESIRHLFLQQEEASTVEASGSTSQCLS